MAKLFKNEMLNHEVHALTTGDLIQLAIQKYSVTWAGEDFEKNLERIFIKSVFTRLAANVKFNFIIFKDATASALQLLTLVLNVKNKQLTQIFNLNSTHT